ncbi:MAG: type II toxin-antitoxin system YoeB family toxin [Anaerolineales bacterium]|nr:type II toxin-antitoxin system YoeB family toxin [Anaerolineales bacterium]MCA9927016.1 type II toxin-antitoxin system YoeB family toxin [Anaerolineales bacterium]
MAGFLVVFNQYCFTHSKVTNFSCWSRGIDREHRFVYQVNDEKIRILACRYHYD